MTLTLIQFNTALPVKKLISKKASHMHICTYINIYGELLEDPRELQELSNAIATNTTITSIVVNHLQLKKTLAESFFKALRHNHSVTFLDLSLTRLNQESFRGFQLLMKNQSIKTLVLQHNELGDIAMLYLTEALSSNTTVTSLDISFNRYGPIGAAYLTGSMSANKTLLSLGLRGNCSSENLSSLPSLIESCPFLKELDISSGPSMVATTTSPSTVVLETFLRLRRSNKSHSYSSVNCGFITEDEDRALKECLNNKDNKAASILGEKNTTNPKLEDDVTTVLLSSSKVPSIDLSRSDLTTVPSYIFFGDEFLGLKSLSLDKNRIRGKLPSQLSRLTNLTHLDLHGNEITEIPASIATLNRLVTLDLRWNELRKAGIPPCVFFLSCLRSLRLQGNPIDELPVVLNSISKQLDVHVQSTLVPRGLQLILFARHQQLTSLVVPRFHLKALPMELGLLTALQSLDLSYNSLVAVPVEIGNLSRLRRLDLRHNELRNLPWTIGQLSKLKELLLKGNPFSELPCRRSCFNRRRSTYRPI